MGQHRIVRGRRINMSDKGKYELIWTIVWFIFISILCFIFKNGYPLLLLFIWILGFEGE